MNIMLTQEFLEKEYLTNGVNVKDIAKQTGYSYSYLQAKIKSFGIQRRRQYKNLENKKFGMLTAKRFEKLDDRQQALWECWCDCGTVKTVKGSRLTSGEIKSCGCLHRKRCGEISGAHFSNIKSHARWDGLKFDLKVDDIWNLYLTQNRKCALSGVEIVFDKVRGKTTASLDRIDSSKGYSLDNVQWVHKEINQMKSDRSVEDFLVWINTIALHQKLKL